MNVRNTLYHAPMIEVMDLLALESALQKVTPQMDIFALVL